MNRWAGRTMKPAQRRHVRDRHILLACEGLRRDYSARWELRRWTGRTWLPMCRRENRAELLAEARPGDQVWFRARDGEWRLVGVAERARRETAR